MPCLEWRKAVFGWTISRDHLHPVLARMPSLVHPFQIKFQECLELSNWFLDDSIEQGSSDTLPVVRIPWMFSVWLPLSRGWAQCRCTFSGDHVASVVRLRLFSAAYGDDSTWKLHHQEQQTDRVRCSMLSTLKRAEQRQQR